jgi:hypothetical protein
MSRSCCGCGSATGIWTAEVHFDRFGEMYLAGGWKRFCRVHQIEAVHFLVFNFEASTCFPLASSTKPYVIATTLLPPTTTTPTTSSR